MAMQIDEHLDSLLFPPARFENDVAEMRSWLNQIDLLQISLPLLLKPRKMRKHQDITIYQRPDDELYNSSNAFI